MENPRGPAKPVQQVLINGVLYQLLHTRADKEEATELAEDYRGRGHLVKVFRRSDLWTIWVHRRDETFKQIQLATGQDINPNDVNLARHLGNILEGDNAEVHDASIEKPKRIIISRKRSSEKQLPK